MGCWRKTSPGKTPSFPKLWKSSFSSPADPHLRSLLLGSPLGGSGRTEWPPWAGWSRCWPREERGGQPASPPPPQAPAPTHPNITLSPPTSHTVPPPSHLCSQACLLRFSNQFFNLFSTSFPTSFQPLFQPLFKHFFQPLSNLFPWCSMFWRNALEQGFPAATFFFLLQVIEKLNLPAKPPFSSINVSKRSNDFLRSTLSLESLLSIIPLTNLMHFQYWRERSQYFILSRTMAVINVYIIVFWF